MLDKLCEYGPPQEVCQTLQRQDSKLSRPQRTLAIKIGHIYNHGRFLGRLYYISETPCVLGLSSRSRIFCGFSSAWWGYKVFVDAPRRLPNYWQLVVGGGWWRLVRLVAVGSGWWWVIGGWWLLKAVGIWW